MHHKKIMFPGFKRQFKTRTLYAVVFIATSTCYTIIQPYKLATYNTVASGIFLILAIDCLLVEALFAVSTNAPFYLHLTIILIAVADTLPQLYITKIVIRQPSYRINTHHSLFTAFLKWVGNEA